MNRRGRTEARPYKDNGHDFVVGNAAVEAQAIVHFDYY